VSVITSLAVASVSVVTGFQLNSPLFGRSERDFDAFGEPLGAG
jgi:hypothetical protein